MRSLKTNVARVVLALTVLALSSNLLVASEGEEHGLPQSAVEIGRPLGFPITNSMVVTWVVALGLIVFAQVATRQMKPVPQGAQEPGLSAGLCGRPNVRFHPAFRNSVRVRPIRARWASHPDKRRGCLSAPAAWGRA